MTPNVDVFSGDLRQNTETQEHSLGAKANGVDGSVYRYVQAGATALVPGKLYDGPAEVANHQNVACAVAAAGALEITVTLGATDATANQYAGGVIVINDVDGQGFTYLIKSHPAAAGTATCAITLDESTPVVTALTTNSQATLVPTQHKGVIIHAATETGIPVGVAVTAITAEYYGWIKTRGPVSLLMDAAAGDVGKSCGASTTTDGSGTANDGTLREIGASLATGVSTEYNPVFLTID